MTKKKDIISYVKTDSEKQAAKGMEIVNKLSLKHKKTKHPSQVCRADRWLSYGRSTGATVAVAEKLKELLTLVVTTWELREVAALKPLLIGDMSEELSQSEVSAEEVLDQINKMYNNKHCKKQMVLTQEFSKLLLN